MGDFRMLISIFNMDKELICSGRLEIKEVFYNPKGMHMRFYLSKVHIPLRTQQVPPTGFPQEGGVSQ